MHASFFSVVTAAALLCSAASGETQRRAGGKAPGPDPGTCGRVRVFMAPDGMQHGAPRSGPVNANMTPGSTLRILAWIEDTTAQGTLLDGYQVVLYWNAAPLAGATGYVEYRDEQPGQAFGESVVLDMDRPDWVLADQPVDAFPVFYNETPPGGMLPPAFGLIFTPAAGFPTILDGRGILYLCEFELQASKNAGGRFELTFTQEQPPPPPLTQIFRPFGQEYVVDEYQPLVIHIAAGPAFSDPPDGAIDARQPSQPDGSDPAGIAQVGLFYTGPAPAAQPEDFEVAVSAGPPPVVLETTLDGNAQILHLDSSLPVGECTTITHLPSGFQTRLGFLPGDVDGDGTSGALDILALIDGLNCVGQPPLTAMQCDIDRSGMCLPADILREIDLLNGAGAFDPWNGRSLPKCP